MQLPSFDGPFVILAVTVLVAGIARGLSGFGTGLIVAPVAGALYGPKAAFVILVGMWLTIAGFILTARRQDKLAPWLFLPYLAWVSFAGYLNLSIALLN